MHNIVSSGLIVFIKILRVILFGNKFQTFWNKIALKKELYCFLILFCIKLTTNYGQPSSSGRPSFLVSFLINYLQLIFLLNLMFLCCQKTHGSAFVNLSLSNEISTAWYLSIGPWSGETLTRGWRVVSIFGRPLQQSGRRSRFLVRG